MGLYTILITLDLGYPDVVLIFLPTRLCIAWRVCSEVLASGNNRTLHCPGSKDPKGGGQTAAIRSHWKMADNSFSWEMSLIYNTTILHAEEVPQARHTLEARN